MTCISRVGDAGPLLWILDICQYILYFIFPLFTSRKTQLNTYQNSYSDHFEFPQYYLLSNNSISHLLQLEPLVFPDYALFSNHDHGYADLSKCMEFFNHLFLYCFSFIYFTNRQTSRYLVRYLSVKELLEN